MVEAHGVRDKGTDAINHWLIGSDWLRLRLRVRLRVRLKVRVLLYLPRPQGVSTRLPCFRTRGKLPSVDSLPVVLDALLVHRVCQPICHAFEHVVSCLLLVADWLCWMR